MKNVDTSPASNQNLDAEWGESRMTVLFKYVKGQGIKEGLSLDCMYSSSTETC